MNTKRKIAFVLLLLASIGAIGFGALYMSRSHIMAYHIAFLGMDEAAIAAFNEKIVSLFVTLIKVAGAGMMGVGVGSLLIVLGPFRKGNNGMLWGLLGMFIVSSIPIFFYTYKVAQQIPAGQPKPPFWLTLALLVLLIAGMVLAKPSKKS